MGHSEANIISAVDCSPWIFRRICQIEFPDTTPYEKVDAAGAFSARVAAWAPDEPYEFRAAARHPVLTMYGDSKKVRLP